MVTDTVANEMPQDNQQENDAQTPSADKPFSLAHHITYLLQEAGVENPQQWLEGLHPEALTHPDIHVQRFQINRRWVEIFTSLKTEDEILQTRNARGCLMGIQCSLEDYLRLFTDEVIPCAIRMGLLKKIG